MRALLFFLLSACGRPIVSTCHSGPVEVISEVLLDCIAVDRSVDLVRRLWNADPREVLGISDDTGSSFEEYWPVLPGDFDVFLEGTPVVIQEGDSVGCWNELDLKQVGGCADRGTIYMPSFQQRSFGHELMHVVECRRGDCHNMKHEGWETNGFKSFSQAYIWDVTDGSIFVTTSEFNWVYSR